MATADIMRVVAIFTTMVAIAVLPWALHPQYRPARAWILLAGIVFWAFSAMEAIGSRFGHRLMWYRTPLTLVGSALILVYALLVIRATERS